VALCLRLTDASFAPATIEEASGCFASQFGRDQHLDMLILTPEQEQTLQRVCRPFFS